MPKPKSRKLLEKPTIAKEEYIDYKLGELKYIYRNINDKWVGKFLFISVGILIASIILSSFITNEISYSLQIASASLLIATATVTLLRAIVLFKVNKIEKSLYQKNKEFFEFAKKIK